MTINKPYRHISELPAELPVFPLAGALLLPRSELPLNIFEPRYLAMFDSVLASNRLVGMIQPVPDSSGMSSPGLCAVGCAGKITRFAETGDGRYFIGLDGVCRFRVGREIVAGQPFRTFSVDYSEFAPDLEPIANITPTDRGAVLDALRSYAERNSIGVDWDAVSKAADEALVNALSMMSPFGVKEKQALLEAPSLRARAEVLVALAEMDLAAGASSGRPPLH